MPDVGIFLKTRVLLLRRTGRLMVKALACRTYGSRFKFHHALELGWHPLVAWWKSVWWECSPTGKRAEVWAIMSMWLVHKKNVWTVGTCLTAILLPDCRMRGRCIKAKCRNIAFPQVVLKQICVDITHVLPRELIWEEVAPSHKWMKHWKALHKWIL